MTVDDFQKLLCDSTPIQDFRHNPKFRPNDWSCWHEMFQMFSLDWDKTFVEYSNHLSKMRMKIANYMMDNPKTEFNFVLYPDTRKYHGKSVDGMARIHCGDGMYGYLEILGNK